VFVEIVEINVQVVAHQQMLLILFGSVWIAIENIIQNVHVVAKLKKEMLEQVRSVILATRLILAQNAE
jgi:hypothetical protein